MLRPVIPRLSISEFTRLSSYGKSMATETTETQKTEVPKPSFAFKGDQFTSLRLLVSEQAATYIVGPGGSNLQRLRDRIDGAINVDGEAGKPATVTFQSLKSHILWSFGEIAAGLDLAPYPPSAHCNHEVIIDILVPENICGYLIGKSGVVIRNLSKQFSVFAKVGSEILPGSSEKLLIVAGRYQNVDAFLEHILIFYYNYPLELSTVRMFNPYGNWTLPPPENFYQRDANFGDQQYQQASPAHNYAPPMQAYHPSMMAGSYQMPQPMYQQPIYQKAMGSAPVQMYQQPGMAVQPSYSEVPVSSATATDSSQLQDYSQYTQSYQQATGYYSDPYAYARQQQYTPQQAAATTETYATQQTSVRPAAVAAATTQYQYTQ